MSAFLSPTQLSVVAGTISTAIFAASLLPMLARAVRTRDLSSYSTGHLVLSNAGNAVHTVYVLSLPAGPVWALHGVYLTVTGLMLAWKLRWAQGRRQVHRGPASAAYDALPLSEHVAMVRAVRQLQ